MKKHHLLNKHIFNFSLFFAALLAGCSSETGMGGASSEVTNAVITFQVDTTSDDLSTHTFTYEIVPANTHPDDYSDSVIYGTTDTKGFAICTLSGEKKWSLEIISNSLGYHKSFSTILEDTADLGIITLGKFSIIDGNIDLDISHNIDEVILPGSKYSSPTDEQGGFEFLSLPPGDWSLDAGEFDDPVEVRIYEDESISIYDINRPDGYKDRELLGEILDAHSNKSKDVDQVATFEMDNGYEVATYVNLSGLSIAPDSLDGSGLPRMSQMNPIEMDLSDNGLTAIPTQWGWHWDRIERLDLSNNKLQKIKRSYRDMQTLKYLDLRNNNLIVVPKDFAFLTPDTVLVEGNKLNIDSLSADAKEWLDLYAEPDWDLLQR